MEGLFPRRSLGWLILTIIALIFFWKYYEEIYPDLYTNLIDQYKTHESKLDCGDGLDVQLRYPKKISEYTEQNLLIEVINNDTSTVPFLGVSVKPVEHDYGKISVTTLHTSFDMTGVDDVYFPAYIKFDEIPPLSTTSGVFWMYVKSAMGDEMKLQISCFSRDKTIDKTILSIKYNQVSALQHGLIDVIVLPPWSNVFLLIIALVIVKLTEDYVPHLTNDEGDNISVNTLTLMGNSLVVIILLLGYSLVVYGLFLGLANANPKFSHNNYLWCGIGFVVLGYVLLASLQAWFYKLNYCPKCGRQLSKQ